MVHVVDADEELMWTDDHNPPVPTTQWKPGQTVEYTRTVFVPIYPYVGEATIQVGPVLDDRRRSACRCAATTPGSAPTRSPSCSCSRRPRTCSRCSRTAGTRPRSPSTTRPSSGSGPRRTRRCVQEPEEGLHLLSRPRQPRRASSRSRSRSRSPWAARRSTQFTLQPKQRAAEDPAHGGPAGHRRHGRTRDFGRQDLRAGCACRSNSKDPRELGVRVFHAVRRSPMKHDCAIAALRASPSLCVRAASRHAARARAGVFQHGRTLSVKAHRDEGDSLVLMLRTGGEIVCDASIVSRFAPDEVPYPEPEAEAPAAPVEADRRRPAPYSDIIDRVVGGAGRRRVKLVRAVIQVESAYNERARSPKGAMGLMQLMPATARQYAVADPYDPAANIEAGIKYLKSLLERLPVGAGAGGLQRRRSGGAAVQRHPAVSGNARTTSSRILAAREPIAKPRSPTQLFAAPARSKPSGRSCRS